MGFMRPAPLRAVLDLTEKVQMGGSEVTMADVLVLAPWLIFGAGLATIGYRLFHRRSTLHRHRRHIR